MWWGPNRQVGALWIVILANQGLEFFKILRPRDGFFRRFFAAKKAVKEFTLSLSPSL